MSGLLEKATGYRRRAGGSPSRVNDDDSVALGVAWVYREIAWAGVRDAVSSAGVASGSVHSVLLRGLRLAVERGVLVLAEGAKS